ncbi:MAG: TSUP family transporter [Streptosporangiales bacterium]|nr:TSUP family transporter [Streptosporangiales bacterium]
MDIGIAVAGFLVGVVVGLTGMGGGALMTPMLMLFFGVQPLAAVSSDLVASAVMKPVGSLVHLRRGTVQLSLVKWLVIGSVPCAFSGVLVARALGSTGSEDQVQHVIRIAMGIALLFAAGAMIFRAYMSLLERARHRREAAGRPDAEPEPESGSSAAPEVKVRRVPTLLIGAVGGLVVGMTSVGSGSLIIVALLMLYPALKAGQLVGTDLVQAVPLVLAAAVGHLLFGDFRLDVTTALLVGSVPGVYLGSLISSRAPSGLIRRALAVVLVASGLKLLGLGNVALGWTLLAVVLAAPALWMLLRTRHGFAPLASLEGRRSR